MIPKIRILHIDDNDYNRLLVKEILLSEPNNYEIVQVDSREKLEEFLSGDTVDLILSNFDIFDYKDLSIIKAIKDKQPGVPLIIVTGKGSEEIAVKAMKLGADDYVIKSARHIGGIADSVKVVLERSKSGDDHKSIKTALDESKELFRTAFENAAIGVCMVSMEGKFISVNRTFCNILGYSKEDLELNPLNDFTHSSDKDISSSVFQQLIKEQKENAVYEKRYIHQSGRIVWVNISVSVVCKSQNKLIYFVCYVQDITERKHVEETIRQERILLRTLINSLPDTIYVKDIEGRKLIANTADLAAMNCSSEAEIIGKTDLEIFRDEAGERGYNEDLLVLRTGKPLLNHEEFYIDAEGRKRWRITSKIPLYNENRQIIGLVGFGHDITERIQAEESLVWEQYLMHTLMDNIPDAIYFKDLNSRFIRVNKAMATLFGLDDAADAIGKTDYDFFKTDHSQQAFMDEQEIIRTGIPVIGKEEMETWLNRPPTWVLSTKMPLKDKDAKIIGTFGMSRSITERKQAEEELLKAKEKAEESDRLKTAFLHNISHEIRTPMNAIVGFSEYLNKPDLPAERREYFTDIIVKSSNQLLSIITDIVNIATIEAGQEKIQETEVSLNDMLRLLHNQFIIKAQRQHISLNYKLGLNDNDAMIVTDETKLTEILSNLIGNALKFTKEGVIDFGYTHFDSVLSFYVKDTGIGIPEAMHQDIFQRFRQVESSSNRHFGGSGLGLSISKAYAEMLGGNIWVESEPGSGSTFKFTIIYKKTTRTDLPEVQPMEKLIEDAGKSQTILIAEDEDYNFMLLEELLSGLHAVIIRAHNGKGAVDMCKTNLHIDLVLMDIKMPDMDGYEATRRIKEIRPNLPIIAQTAYNVETDKMKAFASGCDDFITKPFKQEVLIAKVKEGLMRKS
jgi:PAS domain S-box-containing protein